MPSSHAHPLPVSRRPWRWAAAVAAVLVVALLALYLATPWLGPRLAGRFAQPLGLAELHLRVGRPGLYGVRVPELSFSLGRVHVTANGGTIDYRPGRLLSGQLDQARFRHVDVTVREPATGTTPHPAQASTALPDDVSSLLAALPVDRLLLDDLQVSVPELEFAASGSFRLSGAAAVLQLAASSPDAARGLALDARVGADGIVSFNVEEAGSGAGAPLLSASTRVRPGKTGSELAATGTVALSGFAFDLAANLAGLPAGEGNVDGAFSATTPWPPSVPWNPAALAAEGSLHGRWSSRGGALSLRAVGTDWQFAEGVLKAHADGSVADAGRLVRLHLDVDRLRPDGASGHGAVTAWYGGGAPLPTPTRQSAAASGAPAPAAADTQPLADVEWTLAADALTVEGRYRLSGAVLDLAAAQAGLPPGDGSLAGDVALRVPWPQEPWPSWGSLAGRGSLEGSWHTQSGDLGVRAADGHWRLEKQRLSGDLKGAVEVSGTALAAALDVQSATFAGRVLKVAGTVAGGRTVRLPFTARHDLNTGRGSLTAAGDVTIDRPLGQDLIVGWNQPFDLTAGQGTVSGRLDWRAGAAPGGAIQLGLSGVTAAYEDYQAAGISGTLAFSGTGANWSLAPSPLEIRELHTGVSLANVSTGVAWSGDSVTVDATSAELLGGSVRTGAFGYRLDSGVAGLVVELADLDLAQILALEGEHVSGTGSLDGTLPVQVRGHRPAIVAGRVQADPPGGVIHVAPAIAGAAGQPGLDFALRALQDFQYSALSADVDYGAAGDLVLAVHLEGRNPAVQGGRPIHYNLTVSENVPTLLKSLRLQEEVTRRIERRLKD